MRIPGEIDRVRRLVEATDEAATLDLFLGLCRNSAALRHWLWEDFGSDADTRETSRRHVAQRRSSPQRFIELTDAGAAWREELRRVKARIPRGVYGGLTWSQLEKLIATYRAGRTDLGAFLLAQQLQRETAKPVSSARLSRAAVDFLRAAFTTPRLLRQLERAIELTRTHADKTKRRSALGYSDWWKFQTLVYLLRHPRPAYRIRDLRAHLASLGLNVSVKDLQRFCVRHGIKRDMRAGRPGSAARLTPEPLNGHASKLRGRPTASDLHRP